MWGGSGYHHGILVLCLCVVLVEGQGGLNAGEKGAMQDLLQFFPLLRDIPDQRTDGSYYGMAWSSNFDQLCISEPGWEYYGVHCSNDGHIDAIWFDEWWGPIGMNSIFGTASSLPFLTNFSTADNLSGSSASGGANLLDLLLGLNATTMEHLSCKGLGTSVGFGMIGGATSLRTLSSAFGGSSLDFSNLMNLEYVDQVMGESSDTVLTSYITLQQSVKTLLVEGGDCAGFQTTLNNLANLRKLRVTCWESQEITTHAGLETLEVATRADRLELVFSGALGSQVLSTLKILPSALLGTILGIPQTLKSLSVSGPMVGTISTLPGGLEILSLETPNLANLTPFKELPNLKDVSFYGSATTCFRPYFWSSLTGFNVTNVLKTGFRLSINSGCISNETLSSLVCSLPPQALAELTITATSPNYNEPMVLPNCLSNATGFQSLTIQNMAVVPSFLDVLPPSTKNLRLYNITGLRNRWFSSRLFPIPSSLPQLVLFDVLNPYDGAGTLVASEFYRMTRLNSFRCSDCALSGSLPPNFFYRLPNLTSFEVPSNQLSGTIPWLGLRHLTTLDLSFNEFTHWPPWVSDGGSHPLAPNLRSISISGNPLTTLPDDNSFYQATQLEYLEISSCPSLGGPLPHFWASHPTIRSFNASGSQFIGDIPNVIYGWSKLKNLILSNNRLCGPLFIVESPPSINPLPHPPLQTSQKVEHATYPDKPKEVDSASDSDLVSKQSIRNGPGKRGATTEPSYRIDLFHLDLANNEFSGTVPSSWSSGVAVMTKLDLSNNYLSGTLPTLLLLDHSFRQLSTISLNDNDFTGPLFQLKYYTGIQVLSVDTESTFVEPCRTDPSGWISMVKTCKFSVGATCNCSEEYGACENSASCVPNELDSPEVRAPSFVSRTCNSPLPRPHANNAVCPPPAPSSTGYFCIDGTWTSFDSVSATGIVIPPGKAVVTIQGNLTVTGGTITFQDLNGIIKVNGCIYISDTTEIEVQMTEQEMEQIIRQKKIEKTLITSLTGNQCSDSTNLQLISVKVVPPKKSCRKIKIKNQSNQDSLNLLFTVDNSQCNLAIILPSVFGGILVLTAIALTVGLVIRQQRFRTLPKDK